MSEAVLSFLVEFMDLRLAVALLSALPISEARIAIPMAIEYGMKPLHALLFGFLGSTIMGIILLVSLLPLIRLLTKSQLFAKIGDALLVRAQEKAEKIGKKKTLGLMLFAAAPLPLTGVWTTSLIAGVLAMPFRAAALALIFGNFVASATITITSVFFAEYINIIVLVLGGVALLSVIFLLIKVVRSRH